MTRFQENQKTVFERIKNLRQSATKSELVIKDHLDKLGIKYCFQKGFIQGFYCIVGLYIPKLKLCIEVDGDYHLDPEQIRKDKMKDDYLTKTRNFNVLRISNKMADALETEDLARILSVRL